MNILETMRRELNLESEAIRLAAERLDESSEQAVKLLFDCRGKVIVTGMGKAGIIGRKIAATLTSTGTTAVFLHAAEGIHGDLGMVGKGDVLIAVSNSGNTGELLSIIPYIRFMKVPIIAFTGNGESKLAAAADVVLDCSVPRDYDPFGYVPTASTTVALAMGDAVAVALLKMRNFDLQDFARFHPGGTIGRKLLLRVGELMHEGKGNPIVSLDTPMDQVIVTMISGGLGCTGVIGADGCLKGIVTDGDFKRVLAKKTDIMGLSAKDVMTPNPKTVSPDTLAIDALNLMEDFKITMLPVVDPDTKPLGMLHMHDLIQAGVVG